MHQRRNGPRGRPPRRGQHRHTRYWSRYQGILQKTGMKDLALFGHATEWNGAELGCKQGCKRNGVREEVGYKVLEPKIGYTISELENQVEIPFQRKQVMQ